MGVVSLAAGNLNLFQTGKGNEDVNENERDSVRYIHSGLGFGFGERESEDKKATDACGTLAI